MEIRVRKHLQRHKDENIERTVIYFRPLTYRDEIHSWCWKNFGQPGRRWRWTDYTLGHTVGFTDEKDAAFFMLRWE